MHNCPTNIDLQVKAMLIDPTYDLSQVTYDDYVRMFSFWLFRACRPSGANFQWSKLIKNIANRSEFLKNFETSPEFVGMRGNQEFLDFFRAVRKDSDVPKLEDFDEWEAAKQHGLWDFWALHTMAHRSATRNEHGFFYEDYDPKKSYYHNAFGDENHPNKIFNTFTEDDRLVSLKNDIYGDLKKEYPAIFDKYSNDQVKQAIEDTYHLITPLTTTTPEMGRNRMQNVLDRLPDNKINVWNIDLG